MIIILYHVYMYKHKNKTYIKKYKLNDVSNKINLSDIILMLYNDDNFSVVKLILK